jgi:hypothetical protein
MSTTTTAVPERCPSSAEVEKLALAYHALEEKVDAAKDQLKQAQTPLAEEKDRITELVRAFGGAHGEKSKLLHGITWEIMATFGKTTKVDAAAVEQLRLALVKGKKARLLKKLFMRDVRYNLADDAMELIKGEKLTAKDLALVLKCFDTQDRTPTLDVRPKKLAANAATA